MPTTTTTSVTNGNPATVDVTVRDTPGGGGTSAKVDVLLVVDLTFATVDENSTAPAPASVSNPPCTLRWKDQQIAAGDTTGITFKVPLNRAANATVDRAPITVVVTGTSGGKPYFDMHAPVVTFPPAATTPQP